MNHHFWIPQGNPAFSVALVNVSYVKPLTGAPKNNSAEITINGYEYMLMIFDQKSENVSITISNMKTTSGLIPHLN